MREILQSMRAKLAARPDTEHEQAIVRVMVAAVLGLYLIDIPDLAHGRALRVDVMVYVVYFILSAGLLASTLISGSVSQLRRFVALAGDLAMVTWAMGYFGERALALFLVYIWVIVVDQQLIGVI
ncbi:MAG: hypothetical protein ABI630_04760, partial [Betaproteobacteria bacterium]